MSYDCNYCGDPVQDFSEHIGMHVGITLRHKDDFNITLICAYCFLQGKHLTEMGNKWKSVTFGGATESEIRSIPKNILKAVDEESYKELEKHLAESKDTVRMKKNV